MTICGMSAFAVAIRVKRTPVGALHMSAVDPKRTLDAHFEPPFGIIIWRATIPYLDTWGGDEATRLYWFARRRCRLPIRRARAAGSGRPPYRRVAAVCNRQSGKGPYPGVPQGIAEIGLDRRSQSTNRVSLGDQRFAESGNGIGGIVSGRHPRQRHSRCERHAASDQNSADRIYAGCRSGQCWLCCKVRRSLAAT